MDGGPPSPGLRAAPPTREDDDDRADRDREIGALGRPALVEVMDLGAADDDPLDGVLHVAQAVVGQRDLALDPEVGGERDQLDWHRRAILARVARAGNDPLVMGRVRRAAARGTLRQSPVRIS
jgi:hypothetical protein